MGDVFDLASPKIKFRVKWLIHFTINRIERQKKLPYDCMQVSVVNIRVEERLFSNTFHKIETDASLRLKSRIPSGSKTKTGS